MIKLLKFSFLPSFYCSVSIWCSKDQLKSLVTVETTPDCPPTAACLPLGPWVPALGVFSNFHLPKIPQTHLPGQGPWTRLGLVVSLPETVMQ